MLLSFCLFPLVRHIRAFRYFWPFWPGPIERAAFVRWLDELRAKSGKQIGVDFDPPPSRSETTGAVARLH